MPEAVVRISGIFGLGYLRASAGE